ncbi:amine oxidase, putative [Talaromyces stipitatus ATCC 10500]|uniref:Amine oxidase n=1 Tax=Talaromyces stipitatus (strain ATCC 10500 / CBS 375.48 / QM 6759 / NRRL 1006) TaxID=441959 RepID=B8M1G4_TALSN|nr:amine oxidase, putative [Talaromyces stipitatus ATCC 10500]EED21860.1 amine oxidase, putative [Talaromyces stipitatus ATCC 10500]
MPIPRFDVAVVGAGLSGLRAATLIQQAGYSCAVLEAMDRVGGKTYSHKSVKGGKIDLGAAWINDTNQSEMFALAKEFGFDLIKQRTVGLNVHQSADGSFVSFPYRSDLEDSPDTTPELKGAIEVFNKLVESSNLEHPEQGPNAKMLDSVTFHEFIQEYAGEEGVAMANHLSQALLGVEAEELSALYMIDYIKSGTGLANMASDEKHGGQYLRNRQGNQSFSLKLAEMLAPNSVFLSTPVSKITQLQNGKCEVSTKTSLSFECKRVVVSVPTCLYPTITFEPALPAAKRTLAENTALGYYSKMIFVFDSPWWREAGFSGVVTSDEGPICFSRDTCSEEDGQYSITCFLVGDVGRRWSKFSAAMRKKQVKDQFYAAFRSAKPALPTLEPIEVIEKEWAKDPWTKGAPSPVMMPGTMTSESGQAIRSAFENVHFIGTETAYVWKGYLEGAVRSGKRGAAEVVHALGQRRAKV